MSNINILEKPPISLKLLARNILLAGISLALGLALTLQSVSDWFQYRRVHDYAVNLEATVVKVEEDYDSELGDRYHVYVEYVYNGKTYRTYYDTSGSAKWLGRIGEAVSFTINPEEPYEGMDDLIAGIFGPMLFGLPLLAYGVKVVLKSRWRLSWVENYGMQDVAIRSDLNDAARDLQRTPFLKIYGIGALVFGLFSVDIGFTSFLGIVCLLPFIISGISALVLDSRYGRVFKSTDYDDREPYSVRKFTVRDMKIEEVEDEEEKQTIYKYHVLLESQTASVWHQYTKRKYRIMDVGMEIISISCCEIVLEYLYDKEKGIYRLM